MMHRREFLKVAGLGVAGLFAGVASGAKDGGRPNFLFCMADDWGWPHAGAYGDAVVKTPTFDRVAKEGVLFEHAYVSSPSCTPSRNAIFTCQYHWRLGEGASLHSTLDVNIPVYPLLLAEAGYDVGHWRKSWGPGDLKAGGYVDSHPAGTHYKQGFKQFMAERQEGRPFCFWLGSSDPHRKYDKGSGKASGMDISKIELPKFYPDVEEIRSDVADYYWEVQRFDRECGEAIEMLRRNGELDNTIIVMTGDNGMPFPRCKSNLYDMGVRVPMAIRWGAKVKGDRVVSDFMSLIDLGVSFLDAAGVEVPGVMTGRSLLPTLLSKKDGRVDKRRDHMIFGKERHVPSQASPSIDGYPCRGLRTDKYLYIRNFEPGRWPAGVVSGATHPMNVHADCDNGPTKSYLVDGRFDAKIKPFYELSFGKRPGEELYDMENDPDQLVNLAGKADYAKVQAELSSRLMSELKATGDPRATGGGAEFDKYPYRAGYKLKGR